MPLLDERADALRFLHSDGPEVPILLMAAVGTIDGVTVSGASFRNGPGKGSIRSQGDGTLLSWKAPGSLVYGSGVDASTGGDFFLPDGEDSGKFLRVNVQTGFLSATANEGRVYLRDRRHKITDEVSAFEAASGKNNSFGILVKNVSGSPLSNLVVWVDGKSNFITVSIGGGFFFVTNEEDALVIGTLAVDATHALTIKRIVPAGTGADARRVMELHFRFDGR